MYHVTCGEDDELYPDSLTAEAATAMRLAEETSRRHPGVLVKAWEVEDGGQGPSPTGAPLAEFRDGVRVDIGG